MDTNEGRQKKSAGIITAGAGQEEGYGYKEEV